MKNTFAFAFQEYNLYCVLSVVSNMHGPGEPLLSTSYKFPSTSASIITSLKRRSRPSAVRPKHTIIFARMIRIGVNISCARDAGNEGMLIDQRSKYNIIHFAPLSQQTRFVHARASQQMRDAKKKSIVLLDAMSSLARYRLCLASHIISSKKRSP